MNKSYRKIYSIGAFALLLGAAVACSEEEPINMPPSFSLNEVGSILRTSAVFSGSISGDLNHISEYGFQYSLSQEFSASMTTDVKVGEKPSSSLVQQTISGLDGGKVYYYRMYASTGASKVFSSSKFFQTERSSAPKMSALAVDSIGENFIRFLCTIEDVGDEHLIEYGVQYRESGDNSTWIPFASDSIVDASTNTFYVEVSGLEAATRYSFRPYAKNSADATGEETGTREGYGTVEEHTTENQLSAVVETVEPVEGNVGMSSVDMSGRVTSAIGSNGAVDEVGFCYSQTNKTPIIADSYVKSTFTKLNEYFSASITGLKTSSTYYVRAYAKNTVDGKERIGYGAVFEISTSDIATPKVEWIAEGHDDENDYDYYYDVSTATTITVKAKITNYDKGALIEKGFIWDKSNGEISLEKAHENKTYLSLDLEIGDQLIDATITGLEMGQSYYIRPYAVYEAAGMQKVGYADWTRTITTQNFQSPSLDNVEVPETDITRTSAKLVGKISSNGNGEISERGFCMSYVTTTYEPTLTNSDFIYKSDDSFTTLVTGLKTNTEYAVRSYVISKLEAKVDTTYSGWRTCFYTKDIVRPTFNNIAVDEDTKTVTSFTLSTKIAEMGDGELIEKGFCWMEGWSDLTLETALGSQKVEGDDFVGTLTGLKPNTWYSYKAYAKMKVDGVEYVYYSDQRDTSTKSITNPSIELDNIDRSITSFTFVLSVKDGDGEVIEKGILWQKAPEDGSWPDFTLETGADGSLKCNELTNDVDTLVITGLDVGTGYHVKAYAKMKIGDYEYVTYTGGWGSSTNGLNLNIQEITPSGTDISLIGYDYNPVEGITEYGFCWTTDETIAVSAMTNMVKASDLDANNQFKATITELTPNTKYYIGVYAKIGDKIIFDDGRWETTTKGIPTIDSNPSPGKKD